ncbi:MAG: hypothetical protein ACAH80_05670 [Alphaproteobacteria bacterium]
MTGEKKISLNFKTVSSGDIVAMALDTMVSGGLVPGLAALDAARQLSSLDEMKAAIAADRATLGAMPDYKAMADDKDNWMDHYGKLSEETKTFWGDIGKKEKALEQLKFQLYLSSPHKEVRDAMLPFVDELIDKEITQRNTGKVTTSYWQDLLYLSTFGGKITRERPDAWGIAYEFNVTSSTGYKPAVPFNPMESLYEAGMLKQYGEEQKGSNLSPIGAAVLYRLNELHGQPKVQANYPKLSV